MHASGTKRQTRSVNGETSTVANAGMMNPELQVTTKTADAVTVTTRPSIPICLLTTLTIQTGIFEP